MGANSPSWKGGYRCITSRGYVEVYARGHPLANKRGAILEHRLVASEKYGIFAVIGNNVHHIDGNKTNNHPDNLKIISQSEHSKMHNPIGVPRSERKWTN